MKVYEHRDDMQPCGMCPSCNTFDPQNCEFATLYDVNVVEHKISDDHPLIPILDICERLGINSSVHYYRDNSFFIKIFSDQGCRAPAPHSNGFDRDYYHSTIGTSIIFMNGYLSIEACTFDFKTGVYFVPPRELVLISDFERWIQE